MHLWRLLLTRNDDALAGARLQVLSQGSQVFLRIVRPVVPYGSRARSKRRSQGGSKRTDLACPQRQPMFGLQSCCRRPAFDDVETAHLSCAVKPALIGIIACQLMEAGLRCS